MNSYRTDTIAPTESAAEYAQRLDEASRESVEAVLQVQGEINERWGQ